MAINRRGLPRGIKLTVDDVFSQGYSNAASYLAGRAEPVGLAPWTTSWVIPIMDSLIYLAKVSDFDPNPWWGLPVMFPLPQDSFDIATPHASDVLFLDELRIGFDQKDIETGLTKGRYEDWGNAGHPGAAVYAGGKMDVIVRLYEKTPYVLNGSTDYALGRPVFEVSIPSLAFEAGSNPIITPIGARLDRYKSYFIAIECPGLYDVANNHHYAMNNFTVQLAGRGYVCLRDSWTDWRTPEVMNAPKSYQNKTDATVTIIAPASNSVIEAKTIDGIQTAADVIDTTLTAKLDGGMTEEGWTAPGENLLNTAAYECIAVPMFQACWPFGKISARKDAMKGNDLSRAPYSDGTNDPKMMADRRFISLDHPLVIHHVLIARNIDSPGIPAVYDSQLGKWPTSATLIDSVDVGIGSGLRSNHVAYQQVARADITPANKANYILDRINSAVRESDPTAWPVLFQGPATWDYEILEIPMYGDGAHSGTGYIQQGYPIYAGRGDSINRDRTYAYRQDSTSWGVPLTEGCDTFLEVRWVIADDNGLETAAGDEQEVFVGACGSWVYLIGKSPLTAR